MSSTIIGKRLIYEGDELLKNENYFGAIKKYSESERIGYFGEAKDRLYFIANSLNNCEIKDKNLPKFEILIELGEKLLYSGSDDLEKDEKIGLGYLILLNFVPEEKILRYAKMYMNYLSDLNL